MHVSAHFRRFLPLSHSGSNDKYDSFQRLIIVFRFAYSGCGQRQSSAVVSQERETGVPFSLLSRTSLGACAFIALPTQPARFTYYVQ